MSEIKEAVERLTQDLAAREAYIKGADARGVRADQCVDVRLSDLRTLLSALQETLGPFAAVGASRPAPFCQARWGFDGTTVDDIDFRRAAEVYRALSPGGADE